MDLRIPLAFTYRANGLDMTLAQQRIHEKSKFLSVDCSIGNSWAMLCIDSATLILT